MKNIFITFHYTTHGVSYFKNILAAFYSKKCTVEDNFISVEGLSQVEMNNVFDEKKNGFLFDEIYYLTANQDVFDGLSTRRFNYRDLILSDEKIEEQGTKHVWEAIIDHQFDKIKQEIEFVKDNFSMYDKLFMSQIWRNIQNYSISEQIYWLKEYSNIPKKMLKNLYFKNLPIKSLRDTKNIAENLIKFVNDLKKKHSDSRWIINISLGSNETQVAWQILAQSDILPSNSKLIQTYDNKASKPFEHFKDFDIIEVSKKIISEISANIKIYEAPTSISRKLADAKMSNYIKSGFSVLLLGERGIGKTRLAEKFIESEQNFVSVNCAAFTNNNIAESILFGYKKGAFTDAKDDRKGVFEQADNGILFLDEIHHLDKLVQAKLMKAIETDSDNNFIIKPLGDDKDIKVRITLVFASNISIEELRKALLPDFYDRITQLVIEIPPLRESPLDLFDDFKAIWKQMRFEENKSFDTYLKNDKELFKWLKTLDLYGNYRDLQKISIYYKTYLDFDNEIKKMLPQKNAFQFAKNQFEKYISFDENKLENQLIDYNKSPFDLVKDFQKYMAENLLDYFGSAKKIVEHYKNKNIEITDRTIYTWKKGNK